MTTVTVGGPDLRGFRGAGPDEWFRLFLPQPGQARPALPTADGDGGTWWDQVCAMPEAQRPVVPTGPDSPGTAPAGPGATSFVTAPNVAVIIIE